MVISIFHIPHAAFLKLPAQPGDHRKMKKEKNNKLNTYKLEIHPYRISIDPH